MKKIAVIPARYDASRFPGKLLAKLGNKTVIHRTFESTVESGLFDEVYVATDSTLIAEEIQSLGGKVIRSLKKHETGSDRIAEAVADMDVDIILNVQGDTPFINKKPLAMLLAAFEGPKADEIAVGTLKREITDWDQINNPNLVKVIADRDDFALYFSRAPIPYPRDMRAGQRYFQHIGVYAFRKQALLDFSSLPMLQNEAAEKIECIRFLEYGMRIKVVETDHIGVEIDAPDDLERAKKLLSEQ